MNSDEITDLQALEQPLAQRLQSIRQRISSLRKRRVENGSALRLITDHALLRYLERHKGIDIEAMRNELRGLADLAIPAKDGEHHWSRGVMLIIGNEGQVVTVLSPEQVEKWSGRKLSNGECIAPAR